ncbi:MAG: ATP-binding protein, partial [bacterium]|nr:ATP-binding protein [bacterium]
MNSKEKKLKTLANASSPKNLTPMPVKTVELIGREADLKKISRVFADEEQPLLVNGPGGVGKTELCKNYFLDNTDNYNHLGWVDFVGSIKESFVRTFDIEGIGLTDYNKLDERFERIIRFLNKLDKNTLLLINNIDTDKDDHLDMLATLPVKVIANSRIELEGFGSYTLGFLNDDSCKNLFYHHYKVEKDDGYLGKLISLCFKHTLTVELLARAAQEGAIPLKTLYTQLQKEGFGLTKSIGVGALGSLQNGNTGKDLANQLFMIFGLTKGAPAELEVLSNMSLLPPLAISIAEFCDWTGIKTEKHIDSLVAKGWLKRVDSSISMHQLLKMAARYETSPDTEKCNLLIKSLAEKLKYEPIENTLNNKEYAIFAESVMRFIDENDEDLATLANNLAWMYQELGDTAKALRYQMKALEIRELIFTKYHPALAESYSNLALIYKDLGRLEKALEYQWKGIKIYEKVFDGPNLALAISYINLSSIYQGLENLEAALNHQKEGLKMLKETNGEASPYLATSYDMLAGLYHALGKLEAALEYQLKGVEISEKVYE